jgi:acyl-CoA synthetase (AMP-forming)/AMP-acid ligase II
MSGKSLLSYLNTLAEREPNKRLLGGPSGWMNAAELYCAVKRLGRVFASLGLRPGDLAALRAERGVETALAIYALRAAGVLTVLCSPKQTVEETLSACEAEICPRARIERCAAGFSVRIDGQERFVSLNDDADAALPEGSSLDPAFVLFTSGSTGKGKAVVQCEQNHISNLLDSQPLGAYFDDDIALGALPLEHVFGLVLLCGVAVLGYGVYFPEKTDVPSLLRCIENEKITRMNGVPSLYLALAERSADYDLSSLRAGFIGGGPVTAAQFAHIEKTLGMTLIPVYGMSESIGISCASWRDPQAERAGGVGPVYPMNEVRILAPKGGVGEIAVRGPMRMLGYYGEEPLPPEEFYPTGDLGYLDETGVLHLSGRKKEIIIRNGNNLSPRRIEDALLSLSGVRAAAVVGLPDEKQGEVPCAMAVGEVDETALHGLLHKNEWPVGILTVDALPLTASGKPDKQKIREVLLRWQSL